MDLNIIILVLCVITIIILLVVIINNSKKINKLINVQQNFLDNSNDLIDENKLISKIVDKIQSSENIEENKLIYNNLEEEPIIDVDIPKVEQKPMQIPTLDKSETEALLSGFSKSKVSHKNSVKSSFHTQDLGDLAREIKEEQMIKMPRFEEIEANQVHKIPKSVKIKHDFDNRLLKIKQDIDDLEYLGDLAQREERKIDLKKELITLKKQILEHQNGAH